jgi:toxin ParE1/3/4
MAGKRRWTIRLATAAEADFHDILRWTKDQFGEAQARIYAETLSAAVEALADGGPATAGAKARDEIAKGLFTLHVARHGRKGRHFLLFRVERTSAGRELASEVVGEAVEVLRVLHDAMDLPRHLTPMDETE